MERRQLGNTDLNVSVIGFGAWGIGGAPFWVTEGDTSSERAILKAFDLGINFYDTAPVYGFGHSERLVGKVLKPFRDQVILATKCGLRWDETKNASRIRKDCSKKSILKEIDWSLERLQTDFIDLYQIHWPDDQVSHKETMEALLEIQNSGKIRYFGVSNYSLSQLRESLVHAPAVSLQNEYNLLQRALESETMPFCRQHDIGLLAYSPLASGILCGKYGKKVQFTDWRSRNILRPFSGKEFEKDIDKVDKLRRISESIGQNCTNTAINWVVNQPGVTSALVGVKNSQQVDQNAQAVEWELEESVRRMIDEIFSTP